MARPPANRLKVVMFLGSVRQGRNAERVGKFVQNQLRDKYDIEIFDPLKLNFPLLQKPMHFYEDPSTAPELLRECHSKLRDADAFLVVSAEYNHSIPPALSNMMDHFGNDVYSYKPSGIICYALDQYGGMRVAMQLRSFLSELGCLSVPDIFGIPRVNKAIDEHGAPQEDRLVRGLNRLITQLDWHAHSMKNHRQQNGVPISGPRV